MNTQWTNSIHASPWVSNLGSHLHNQLPRMQGSRYEAHPHLGTEFFLIGAHGLERVVVTEGMPALTYVPQMESFYEFSRNAGSWLRVLGDVVFTTKEGSRTVSFSEVLNTILAALGTVEGALIHAPLVDAGRQLLLYIQEPIRIRGKPQATQMRHWQITLPVCRIGEFTWN